MDFPRMLYHEDGRSMTVLNETQEAQAPNGFGREPFDAHRAPQQGESAASVQTSGNFELARTIADIVVARLREDVPPRRGPGRPPKSETE